MGDTSLESQEEEYYIEDDDIDEDFVDSDVYRYELNDFSADSHKALPNASTLVLKGIDTNSNGGSLRFSESATSNLKERERKDEASR